MKNGFYSFLRIALGTFLGFVFLGVACGTLLLLHPAWINREPVLFLAASLLKTEGVDVTWNEVRTTGESLGFLTKRLGFDFRGICVRENQKTGYQICFDRVQIGMQVGVVNWAPKITEIGPIDMSKGTVVIDLPRLAQIPTSKKTREKKKPFRIETVVPAFVQGSTVLPIRVDVQRWVVLERNRRTSGHLLLTQEPRNPGAAAEGAHLVIRARGQADIHRGPFLRNEFYRLDADLSNSKSFWAWNLWTASANAHAELQDERTVDLKLDARPKFGPNPALGFKLFGNTMKNDSLVVVRANGEATSGKIDVHLKGSARNTIPEVHYVHVDSCDLRLQKKSKKGDSRYSVNCLLAGTIPVPPKKLEFLQIPSEASLRIKADLDSSEFIPSETAVLIGGVEIDLQPILTPILEGKGMIRSRLSGAIGEFPHQGTVDSKVVMEIKVPHFEKAVKRLSGTEWAIPAPFQALSGEVSVRAGGGINLSDGLFPIRLQTRLDSKNQNINLDASGTLEIGGLKQGPHTQLNALLMLSKLKVVLPRLGLGLPPRFFPDPRIESLSSIEQAGKVPERSDFGYRITIKTPPGEPAQVVTNLAKAPIPVSLDIVLADDSPIDGTIRVNEFPVELFKRKGTVRYFDLDLAPEVGNSRIDGEVSIPLADYKTLIRLVGTVDKPKANITSDPPVSEQELLSALLFNRSPEDLDASQSATLGSTRATISTGALNLVNLFLVASTPIQGLSYNPDTGLVTAQIRLIEGLSLNVGASSTQSESVGLRKRLGSNWFLTTGFNNNTGGTNANTVSANVQWRKRY